MREFTVEARDAGKRVDKWLMTNAPGLTKGGAQKAFRVKAIRVNGKHVDSAERVNDGDIIKIFLPDDVFVMPESEKEDRFLRDFRVHLHILYEDDNIILADKKPGLMSHPDDRERVNTLLTHIQAYLYQKHEYDSKDPEAFTPALCNRIDRFTGGLVIAAKNEQALKIMNAKIASREIKKYYLCAVHGTPNPRSGNLENYILKPEGSRSVKVLHEPTPGAQDAKTMYRTLAYRNGLSLLECELYTGRTHQIRAQMADINHPLLGDQQYGSAERDVKYGAEYQALYAYRIDFDFQSDCGILNNLKGRSFRVGRVAFADELFPGFDIKTDLAY